jgi:hypothetical protein
VQGGQVSFSGSDLRIMIELVNSKATAVTSRCAKQLIEATGLSVSVLRVTTPARALGYINPKGFALGGRTVAGTIILTQFTVAVLMRFLNTLLISDFSKDTQYFKFDQLPPFNLTLLFNDEYGYASYQRLLGVHFVSDGVISNQGRPMDQRQKVLARGTSQVPPAWRAPRPPDPGGRTAKHCIPSPASQTFGESSFPTLRCWKIEEAVG